MPKITKVSEPSKALQKKMSDDFAVYEAQHGVHVNYEQFSLVATNDEGVEVGVINAYTAFAEIYLDDVWVHSDHRGKGYGRFLVESLEAHFKGQGFNNINLCTNDYNAPGFYEKLGFIKEFTRINTRNPKFNKSFYVKFFDEDNQTQGLLLENLTDSEV